MSFDEVLRRILDDSGAGLGIALMGADGIPIAQITADLGNTPNPLGDDISTAGVEFARILSEIQKASDALNAGALTETVVSLARFHLLFRPVDEDLILVLALRADGNVGKARYLMRRYLIDLEQEL